ncbi:hypothetical protein [Kaistella carnis]|uniref:hypothetical protein n=1 Tax=Kaistella carnis TaxID=1241979 RepID=UPI0028ADD862|nr:hypothetical protein [Kaistella carnis]
MKFIFPLLLSISLLSCSSDKKERINQSDKCYNDNTVKYKYDSLTFWFIEDYENLDLKNVKIYKINNGKKGLLPHSTRIGKSELKIENPLSLKSADTIKIVFENNKQLNLYDFKNTPDYGGKIFLGCSFGRYKLNEEQIEVMDGNILRIY